MYDTILYRIIMQCMYMFTGVYVYCIHIMIHYMMHSHMHITTMYGTYMFIIYVHCTYSNMISYDTVRILYSMILLENAFIHDTDTICILYLYIAGWP